MTCINKYTKFASSQHGFRSGSLTESVTYNFTDFILKGEIRANM